MRLVVAIYGPTSSGKTALSVGLCQLIADRLGSAPVVISADSRQVYRFMDIGTSKTTAAEMGGIPHRMIDVTEPSHKLELEQYVAEARGHLQRTLDEGGVPVIVGGTSTYVRALLEGWEVDQVGKLRAALLKDFPAGMAADAHATLKRLDPAAAGKVHANNHAGVINALARVMAGEDETSRPEVNRLLLGVDRPPADLDRRITQTFSRQVAAGLYDEVLQLESRYQLDDQLRESRDRAPNQVLHTHGYAEWFEVARERGRRVHELDVADHDAVRARVLERITTHSRRQRSVLGKLDGLQMVRSSEQAMSLVEAAAKKPRPVVEAAAPAPKGRQDRNRYQQQRRRRAR
jgi:tRNA dimethylallyltransferase